jgi:hypothetical protein
LGPKGRRAASPAQFEPISVAASHRFGPKGRLIAGFEPDSIAVSHRFGPKVA